MSMFKSPSELAPTSTLKVLVYGQPGAGKTTLALSAPNPVLFDFDGGINRVNKAFQVPTLQVSKWEDVVAAIAELKTGSIDFATIVVDTSGKMLDYMSDYIMRVDPKMKMRDGSLALKGYGKRKVMFTEFLKQCAMMGKNVVFVAHEKESSDNDTRIVRPDMSGSSLGDLLKELDLVGYVQMIAKERTVSWTPEEKFYAKNTCALPAVMKIDTTINDKAEVVGENDFLSRVFATYNDYLKQQAKIGEEYKRLIGDIAERIDTIDGADAANAFIEDMNNGSFAHIWDSQARARRLFGDKVKQLNLEFDKKTKRYVTQG